MEIRESLCGKASIRDGDDCEIEREGLNFFPIPISRENKILNFYILFEYDLVVHLVVDVTNKLIFYYSV